MMTLITRLCALCAMSALMQMALPEHRLKSGFHMICGLLMLRLTIAQLQEIGVQLTQQRDLAGLFSCLMH